MQSQDPRRIRIQIRGRSGRPLGLLGSLVFGVLGVLLLIAGFFLSIFLLAAFAGIAVVAGGWFWWRTRRLRRQFDEAVRSAQQAAQQTGAGPRGDGVTDGKSAAPAAGTVIEGDYIRRKDD